MSLQGLIWEVEFLSLQHFIFVEVLTKCLLRLQHAYYATFFSKLRSNVCPLAIYWRDTNQNESLAKKADWILQSYNVHIVSQNCIFSWKIDAFLITVSDMMHA